MNDMRCILMQKVYETGFAVDEIMLYLDTHPCDKDALNYYHRVVQMRREAVAAYENQFGPLTKDGVKSCDEWSWLSGKWPWEGEV